MYLCICVLLCAVAIPLRSDLSLVDWNRIPSIALTAAAPASQCSIYQFIKFIQKFKLFSKTILMRENPGSMCYAADTTLSVITEIQIQTNTEIV